jgi:hypothetical protein
MTESWTWQQEFRRTMRPWLQGRHRCLPQRKRFAGYMVGYRDAQREMRRLRMARKRRRGWA